VGLVSEHIVPGEEKMHVKKVKKVIKGLKKASKLHAKQARSLGTLVKNKKFKNYGKKKRSSRRA
tara:strand:- start:722 stop:913 length:192 start_codon:yes stop_codon:yes gene_type:complete